MPSELNPFTSRCECSIFERVGVFYFETLTYAMCCTWKADHHIRLDMYTLQNGTCSILQHLSSTFEHYLYIITSYLCFVNGLTIACLKMFTLYILLSLLLAYGVLAN